MRLNTPRVCLLRSVRCTGCLSMLAIAVACVVGLLLLWPVDATGCCCSLGRTEGGGGRGMGGRGMGGGDDGGGGGRGGHGGGWGGAGGWGERKRGSREKAQGGGGMGATQFRVAPRRGNSNFTPPPARGDSNFSRSLVYFNRATSGGPRRASTGQLKFHSPPQGATQISVAP